MKCYQDFGECQGTNTSMDGKGDREGDVKKGKMER
jgi:hypothetical protein